MKLLRHVCVSLLITGFLAHSLFAQTAVVGTIEGHAANPANGENLENVWITVEGTALETFTDSTGQYRLTNVPTGAVKLRAFRTGVAPQIHTVSVAAGQVVHQDFDFSGLQAGDDTVKLDQFVVRTSKEMDGAAIAINTQRFASYHYGHGILSMCLTRGRPFVVGKQNYQYSIYTHGDDPFQGDAYNVAKSVNTPFVTYWPEKQAEERSPAFSFLAIDKPNIVLSALYSEGDAIYARFYERSGKETNGNIDVPYLKSSECNQVKLNGEKVRKLQNVNGKVKLDFKPWEIITIAFTGAL